MSLPSAARGWGPGPPTRDSDPGALPKPQDKGPGKGSQASRAPVWRLSGERFPRARQSPRSGSSRAAPRTGSRGAAPESGLSKQSSALGDGHQSSFASWPLTPGHACPLGARSADSLGGARHPGSTWPPCRRSSPTSRIDKTDVPPCAPFRRMHRDAPPSTMLTPDFGNPLYWASEEILGHAWRIYPMIKRSLRVIY